MQQDLLICNCSEQLDGLEKEQVAVAQTIDHKIDWNLEYTYKLNIFKCCGFFGTLILSK